VESSRVFGLKRDYVYSLQFYLRREIPSWTPSDGDREIIFTDYGGTLRLQKQGVACLHYIVFPAVMVCGLPPSVNVHSEK
jgi:hypothetical protein